MTKKKTATAKRRRNAPDATLRNVQHANREIMRLRRRVAEAGARIQRLIGAHDALIQTFTHELPMALKLEIERTIRAEVSRGNEAQLEALAGIVRRRR